MRYDDATTNKSIVPLEYSLTLVKKQQIKLKIYTAQ